LVCRLPPWVWLPLWLYCYPLLRGRWLILPLTMSMEDSPYVTRLGFVWVVSVSWWRLSICEAFGCQAGNRIVALKRTIIWFHFCNKIMPFGSTNDWRFTVEINRRCAIGAIGIDSYNPLLVWSHHVDGSAGMLLYTSPTLAAISCCTLPPFYLFPTRLDGTCKNKQKGKVKAKPRPCEQSLSSISTSKTICSRRLWNGCLYRNAISRPIQWLSETATNKPSEARLPTWRAYGDFRCLGFGGNVVGW
jgi:hypothetical protein